MIYGMLHVNIVNVENNSIKLCGAFFVDFEHSFYLKR